jgi:hypothetical protein
MASKPRREPWPLHEFVEHELGFRNVVRKLRRAASRSPGGIRLVPRPESWLRAEEVLVKPDRAFHASQSFQKKVLAKLLEASASNKWLFTGWCSATRSLVTLGASDFEHERIEIATDQVGRVRSVTVAERHPSPEELIVEAIEQICAEGSPGYIGWTMGDVAKMVEGKLGRLGKTQFPICWRAARIDQRYRKGGKPKGTKHT